MNSFIDTNVSIAYTFFIDPFYRNARNVFKKYALLFWSIFVKGEFNDAYFSKKEVLTQFYKKVLDELMEGNITDFSFKELNGYLKRQGYIANEYKQIKSSLSSFWDRYVKESFPSLHSLVQAIISCLIDLMIVSYTRKTDLENCIILTEERTEEYPDLKRKLIKNGVHPEDAEVILDAHDHNLKTSYDLDFVSFDRDCYNGARLSDFSFHDVKYKWDFTF